MLQVFSAEWCSACTMVKNFLMANKIPFEEKDIEKDKTAYQFMMKLQLRSIPIVYFNDSNYVVGFDKDKILALNELCK